MRENSHLIAHRLENGDINIIYYIQDYPRRYTYSDVNVSPRELFCLSHLAVVKYDGKRSVVYQ